ncbi:MAG: hypothetical protein ABI823_12405 [Bryobacteraceae bacterium]
MPIMLSAAIAGTGVRGSTRVSRTEPETIKDYIMKSILLTMLAATLLFAGPLLMNVRAQGGGPTVTLLAKTYRLGSHNHKSNATWEFVTGSETVNTWSTLVTLIDRPDAKTRPELDRLAEGVMANYKSHSGQVLLAKTMADSTGTPFNYLVAAFEEPAKKRYELNFVKIALGKSKNAYIVVYGVRVADPKEYQAKAKAFLSQQSGPIGKALESFAVPDLASLPKKFF